MTYGHLWLFWRQRPCYQEVRLYYDLPLHHDAKAVDIIVNVAIKERYFSSILHSFHAIGNNAQMLVKQSYSQFWVAGFSSHCWLVLCYWNPHRNLVLGWCCGCVARAQEEAIPHHSWMWYDYADQNWYENGCDQKMGLVRKKIWRLRHFMLIKWIRHDKG